MKTKHLRLMQRAYVILFFCFMYLPIAYMIVFSFNQSKGYALFTGFTLKWYTSLLHNESILHALWCRCIWHCSRRSSPPCWGLRRLWASPPWGARAACW